MSGVLIYLSEDDISAFESLGKSSDSYKNHLESLAEVLALTEKISKLVFRRQQLTTLGAEGLGREIWNLLPLTIKRPVPVDYDTMQELWSRGLLEDITEVMGKAQEQVVRGDFEAKSFHDLA